MQTDKHNNGGPPRNAKVFDQFKLMELYGGDFGKSSMAMLVLRNLLRENKFHEGRLASRVGSRIYQPDWTPFIEALARAGYVEMESTGNGRARSVLLTEKSREFLTANEIEAEPEPGPEETQPQPTE